MIKAVIFDMYETLITHYRCPLYFGAQMAEDAGIPVEKFQPLWRATEKDRSVGKIRFEEVIEMILRENQCYNDEILEKIVQKRVATKLACFKLMHSELLPMFEGLKQKGVRIGLISNCFSEEAEVIRKSCLFSYFDQVSLSYEEKVQKPDEKIYKRCMEGLSVKAEECLYIGDGGSQELETARNLGMKAMQAMWYLNECGMQNSKRKEDFAAIETPLEVLEYLNDMSKM